MKVREFLNENPILRADLKDAAIKDALQAIKADAASRKQEKPAERSPFRVAWLSRVELPKPRPD
jgi:hypothetical protein